jgi:hypothetical protein
MQIARMFQMDIHTSYGPLKEDTRSGHYRFCDGVLFSAVGNPRSACPVGGAGLASKAERKRGARYLGASGSEKLTLTRAAWTGRRTRRPGHGRASPLYESFPWGRSERTLTLAPGEIRHCHVSTSGSGPSASRESNAGNDNPMSKILSALRSVLNWRCLASAKVAGAQAGDGTREFRQMEGWRRRFIRMAQLKPPSASL